MLILWMSYSLHTLFLLPSGGRGKGQQHMQLRDVLFAKSPLGHSAPPCSNQQMALGSKNKNVGCLQPGSTAVWMQSRYKTIILAPVC